MHKLLYITDQSYGETWKILERQHPLNLNINVPTMLPHTLWFKIAVQDSCSEDKLFTLFWVLMGIQNPVVQGVIWTLVHPEITSDLRTCQLFYGAHAYVVFGSL